ncbi:hypothetical protein AK830_g4287 [Neonectria ditissima]|uniref:HNH nuclease domain-containing protein n=1 Tax=Neonectria ditissima TaxID=78410 RepID=A0A0P7B985_9HYPO|nr:hypothetical protein AK830_g4287 [Neonectria ditissima]
MSNDTITPQHRIAGWNIHLLCGPDERRFGGLFHPPLRNSLTFRHIIDELRLCFTIPATHPLRHKPWGDTAFACIYPRENTNPVTECTSVMIHDQYLDQFVSTPVEHPSCFLLRPVLRLHVVRHTKCNFAYGETLETHLSAGCATHIPYPSLVRDERYLPPNEVKDPAETVVPPSLDIPPEQAHKVRMEFRSSCLRAGSRCAVTGRGRSWHTELAVGPTLQVCHIVPREHYHVFPVSDSPSSDRHSPRQLRLAWYGTWGKNNGILLLSHLHQLFDARLFSIDPDTLRVRAFVPYDVVADYHGCLARLPENFDRKALRQHYEMCCIENMAADTPLSGDLGFGTVPRSAIAESPPLFDFGLRDTIIPSATGLGNAPPQMVAGDLRGWQSLRPGEPAHPGQYTQPSTAGGLTTASIYRPLMPPPPPPPRGGEHALVRRQEENPRKRRRVSGSNSPVQVDGEGELAEPGPENPHWDTYTASLNSAPFLADLNREL